MKNKPIPESYKSNIISRIKEIRNSKKNSKKDFTPSVLIFGKIQIIIPRYFGFCFGVENAINIAYRTIEENPDKRIFLLSEMIHNPAVNKDLKERGVQFINESDGTRTIDFADLNEDDIVVIPAFGTKVEIEKKLQDKGIDVHKYETTCSFVKRVWKRSEQLGANGATIVIHGKHKHEETKATFSHTVQNTAAVVIRDYKEAQILCDIITGRLPEEDFYKIFTGKYSEGFDVKKDLNKIGIVNQTTMLARETEEISNCLREAFVEKYGEEKLSDHFCDTYDTLCYATNNNQSATKALLEKNADLAIVVGGYNSSNTTHIAELLKDKFPTYFISSDEKILSKNEIKHFDIKNKSEIVSKNYLPAKEELKIILTSGASCPDSEVEKILMKLLSYLNDSIDVEKALDSICN